MGKINLSSVLASSLWATKDILGAAPLTKLLESGIIVQDENISNLVGSIGTGSILNIPYVKRPVFSEASIGDDSDDGITPTSIDEVKSQAWIGFFNKAFTQKDIVKYVGQSPDPISKAQEFFGAFWQEQIQKQIINTIIGCIESNKANKSGDNVLTNKTQAFEYGLLVDTLALAGERMDEFDLLIVHPKVKAAIKKANKELFKPADFQNGAIYDMYDGKAIITSEMCPVTTETITSFIVKRGAFVFAPAAIEFPIETQRDAKTGKGSGETTVISRMGYLLHPNGYTYKKANQTSVSPSLAELANKTNWERLIDKGQAPFLALETKA